MPGFTLAPAQVPGTAYQTANNGTEYFLSATPPKPTRGFNGQADDIGVFALTNTASIRNANPALHLAGALRPSQQYVDAAAVHAEARADAAGQLLQRDRLRASVTASASSPRGRWTQQRHPDAAGLLRARPALRGAQHRGPGRQPAAGGHRLVPGQPGPSPATVR